MFSRLFFWALFSILAKNLFAQNMENNAKQWKEIDSLFQKGFVESALPKIESILVDAKKKANHDQNIKALAYKVRYLSIKEEDSQIKMINLMKQEAKTAVFPVKNTLHSYLASLHWQYYEQNRWRFYNRTELAKYTDDDLATWSLEQIVAEVLHQYALSLSESEKLKNTPVTIYHEVLGGANQKIDEFAKDKNRALRPSLYDLFAHRAVDFYSNTEADITRPAYQFYIDNAAYLSEANTFISLNISTKDGDNMKFKALLLLQDLLKFHQKDNLDAFADTDLKRIDFVNKHLVGIGNKEEIYLQSIQKAEKNYEKSFVAADFMYLEAMFYKDQALKYNATINETHRFDLKKAIEICDKTIAQYPKTQGARNCETLKNELFNKELTLETERFNASNKPFRVLVNYRNVNHAYFRVLKIENSDLENLGDWENREKNLRKLLERPVLAAWDIKTPTDDEDMRLHKFEAKVPALQYGKYLIVTCPDKDFDTKKNSIIWSYFQVTDLSFIERNLAGKTDFYLLDRNTGYPVANAKVHTYHNEYDYNSRRNKKHLTGTYSTNKDGFISVPMQRENRNYFSIEFSNGNDNLHLDDGFYTYEKNQNQPQNYKKAFFFTDRAIYRPNQTLYFKGIVLNIMGEDKKIVPNTELEVRLVDVNYQEVAKLKVKTNEYGSFSGKFITPNNLNGQMQLQTEGGTHYFSVEDYKRPKFEVSFNPIKETFKLGEKITAKGMAKAYSGAMIDGATVKYRVLRRVRFPYWWFYWYGAFPISPEMEITNGETKSNEKGEFELSFEAIPDKNVPQSSNPIFTYQIIADVIDINGETHIGNKSINVAYTAMEISCKLPERVNLATFNKEVEFKTQNLEGEWEAAKGSYALYKLKTPNTVLRNRLWSNPDRFVFSKEEFEKNFPFDVYDKEDKMNLWEKTKEVEGNFDTEKDKKISLNNLKEGAYLLEFLSKDRFGKEVKEMKYFTVFDEKSAKMPYQLTSLWEGLKIENLEPNSKAKILLGTSFKDVKILYEVEHKGEILSSQWISLSNSQKTLEEMVLEKFRGNFGVHLTFVKEGRSYMERYTISVPHTNKMLDLSFETFRNKLLPNEKEEWKIKIKGKNGDKVAAEMIATLYDASLDVFRANNFDFNILNYSYLQRNWNAYAFGTSGVDLWDKWNNTAHATIYRAYDNLYHFDMFYHSYNRYREVMEDVSYGMTAGEAESPKMKMETAAPQMAKKAKNGGGRNEKASDDEEKKLENGELVATNGLIKGKKKEEAGKEVDLSQVKARSNFNETALFEPQLQTDAEGNVFIKFTIPEALTKWKMLGFAHTKDLKHGFVQNELITQKTLMVIPNAPRFFRENDNVVFSTKITSLADHEMKGTAKIYFFDALTMQAIDVKMYPAMVEKMSVPQIVESRQTKYFSVKGGESTSLNWNISIPDDVEAITYRVVAEADSYSDGEEMTLPVLKNRMLVTESLPLPVRNGETKTFELAKLTKNQSTTLKNHKLTLEFTSNPAWYAIQALPYLMEYPYECSEQIFSRFYANSMASYVANSQPKIKAVFESWKNTNNGSALLSNLEKNQELKTAMLEETPWVMEGKNETERKKQIGVLFDVHKLSAELESALTKLQKMQTPNGGFPWFAGMPDNRWITQHIVCGAGHLEKLGVNTVRVSPNASFSNAYISNETVKKSWSMLTQSVGYLDNRIKEDYEELKKMEKRGIIKMSDKHIGYDQIHYLYARSFFEDVNLDHSNKEAYNYYLNQAKRYWYENGIYAEGMIALICYRKNDEKLALQIVQSLKERSLQSEEMGMYWKGMNNTGYYWHEAPIETQALMVEVFSEVGKDDKAVKELKIWLLKQKQTQDWKTTKATTEACYALLLQGKNWLLSDKLADISLGTLKIEPTKLEDTKVEAGTGYFKTSFSKSEIKAEMGKVTITSPQGDGISWGALYWQYFENLDKITSAATPLQLKKQLFLQKTSDKGLILEEITTTNSLKIGDVVKVRIELKVDRAMEFIHLKDMRAAGFEPMNTLSQYKYQDGLGYYESTRDAATHFFFDYVGKGTYIFEYPLRVNQAGDFSNGIATIQCMYAPEFSSHSEGIRVKIGQ